MFASFTRPSVLSLAIIWLFLFSCLTHAAGEGNFLSHCFEKLWLWENYRIIVAAEGRGQKSILPFNEQRGQESTNNKGHIEMDQTLTYSEFMRRLDNKGLDNDMPQLSKEPKSASELNDAAQELMRNKYGGQIDPGKIDPELRGKKFNAPSNLDDPTPPRGSSWTKDDPFRTSYTVLVDKIENKVSSWRANGNNEKATEAINDRWDRIKNINQNIVTLRQEDTQSYIAKLFRKPTKNNGLGLGDDGSVKTTKEKSAIDIGPEYDKVDIDATLSANKDKLKAQGLGSKKELARWVNGLGNPESKAKKGYADAEKSHFRTQCSWNRAKFRATLKPDELAGELKCN